VTTAEDRGWDAFDAMTERRAALVDRAEKRLAQCRSAETRGDLERRLFTMTATELAGYLDRRDEMDRRFWQERSGRRPLPDPDPDPVSPPLAPWVEPDHDPDPLLRGERAGLDGRLHDSQPGEWDDPRFVA
jgi:hypothetical protein